jgi:hypothetical protein
MKQKYNRVTIRMVGTILVALFIALALVPALNVDACTNQSAYDYGDANLDLSVNVGDYALLKGVVLQTVAKSATTDATASGDSNVADYAAVKSIVLVVSSSKDMYLALYDFNTAGAGTDDLAASKQVAAVPAVRWVGDAGWTNFSGGDYTDVEAIDASDYNMGANATGYNAIQCRFDVDEIANASALTHLVIDLNASTTAATSPLVELYAWDFNTVSWTKVGDANMNGATKEGYSAVSAWGPPLVDDYIDASGYVYIMVIVPTFSQALDVNYVQLALVEPYDDEPCPTSTATATPTATVEYQYNIRYR